MTLERADFGKNRITEADRFFEVIASLGFLKKLNFADNCFGNEERLQVKISRLRPELRFFMSADSRNSLARHAGVEGGSNGLLGYVLIFHPIHGNIYKDYISF